MNRLFDILTGITMILLCLTCQIIAFVPLLFLGYGILDLLSIPTEGGFVQWSLYAFWGILINGIATYIYFKEKASVTLGTDTLRPGVHSFKAIAAPDLNHMAFVIFLFPRGIDRIFYGKEYIGNLEQENQANSETPFDRSE